MSSCITWLNERISMYFYNIIYSYNTWYTFYIIKYLIECSKNNIQSTAREHFVVPLTMTYDKLVFWCNINLWKMQSENTNIELLRNTIDIFMDVTGYIFLVKEQFITFLLDIPWYDVYFIQASQYVFYNLFLIQKWSSIEIKCLHKYSYNWNKISSEHMIFLWNIIFTKYTSIPILP